MPFARGRAQTLYGFLPGALFSHEDYGYCKATSAAIDPTTAANHATVLNAVVDTLQQWREPWSRAGYPDPRDGALSERDFIIGAPTEISFEPFPGQLQCLKCGRVFRAQDLAGSDGPARKCPEASCLGHLAQFRFVQAHNCGRLEEVHLDRTGCSMHGISGLYFDDTGRVRTSRWRCRMCGGREVSRLRQTPCSCAYGSHAGAEDQRKMRFFPVSDPALFRARVVPFVNFQQDALDPLRTSEARPLVLARIWGLLGQPISSVLEPGAASREDEADRALRELERYDPRNPLVLEWKKKQAGRNEASRLTNRVLGMVGETDAEALQVTRRMTEQVAALDILASSTASQVARRLEGQGESELARGLIQSQAFARETLGLSDLRVITDFPIGLVAVGYTRVSANPEDSVLVPFPAVSSRTPLYTIVSDTEAIYLQLDPQRVLAWLAANGYVDEGMEVPSTSPEVWAVMYRAVPGLRAPLDDPSYGAPAAVAVRALLHTMSHILLRRIEWSGYDPQSIGEYLLDEGLGLVLFANRYTQTKVGGLITLFEQHLGEWLRSGWQEGNDCVYDPFCREEGGSCVGCLHREYNCPSFNSELSRAVLYGGAVPREGKAALAMGDVTTGYWESR